VSCNFVRLSPHVVCPVGLVEPVELRGIQRAQVELPGVTGGTDPCLTLRWRMSAVPPVTPTGTTKHHQKGLKYHRLHRLHLPHGGPLAESERPFGRTLESIS
jgi:hypothetical protein